MRASRSFTTTVTRDGRRRVMVPVPFDPDEVWGRKAQHHVAGTVNGMGVRAQRIAEVVDLCRQGVKERPKS